MGIPTYLVNQIVFFLVLLAVQTAGDVTPIEAIVTTGLTQRGAASTALFRIFIDDLVGALRKALPCKTRARRRDHTGKER